MKNKNLFKKIFSVLHKVLSVESQMIISPNNGCLNGAFKGCNKWNLKGPLKNNIKKYMKKIFFSYIFLDNNISLFFSHEMTFKAR